MDIWIFIWISESFMNQLYMPFEKMFWCSFIFTVIAWIYIGLLHEWTLHALWEDITWISDSFMSWLYMSCKIYSSVVTLFAWITYSKMNCLYVFLKICFLWCVKVTMIARATKFFTDWLYVTSEIVFSLCHKSTRLAGEQIMDWL